MRTHSFIQVFTSFLLMATACLGQKDSLDVKEVLLPDRPWNFITSMAQDVNGSMWVATQSGLIQYNGASFSFYTHDPANPASLAHNIVHAICIDKKGTIWAGTDAGLSRLDPATGEFVNYHHIPADSSSVGSNVIHALLEDREGNLWIGTDTGVDRLDKKTGKFRHYYFDASDPTTLSGGPASVIYEDKQGAIWVGTGDVFKKNSTEGGLSRFNKVTNSFTRFIHNEKDASSLSDSRVRSIFEDSKGNFWIGTAGDGLHIMDRWKGTFTRYRYDPANPSRLSRPPLKKIRGWDDFVCFITEDAAGYIWIGSVNGMNRYDPKTGIASYYSFQKDNPLNLFENMYWCSYSSRDGVLWIGGVSTISSALYKIDVLHSKIPYYFLGTAANSVFEESPGTYLVGTEGIGLLQCDRNGNIQKKFTHNSANPASISNDHISIIRKDTGQKLWVGTSGGLNLFDLKTQMFTSYQKDPNNAKSLNDSSVTYVYVDREKRVWVGTQFRGLNLMDRSTGRFTHYTHIPDDSTSLGGNWVSSICEDSKGRLLVGTLINGGLNRLDEQTGKFIHYLQGTTINYLYKDHNGILWVATSGLLYSFDVELDKLVPFVVPQTGKNIMFALNLLEDADNNLWICSTKGILRLDNKREKLSAFGEAHGVKNNVFAYGDGILGREGNIIFCDQLGYYSFFPEKIITNTNPPELGLIDFTLQDQSIKDGKEKIRDKPFVENGEIHLNYKQNFFSFGFKVVDYSNRQNDFSYWLENYDKDWRKGNTDLSASYFHVQPGEYSFHLRVVNSEGLSAEKSIRLIISPPWWKTWWAYVLYGLVLVFAVAAFTYYRSRSLRQEKRVLEERVAQRTSELNQSLQELKSTQAQLIQSEKMASLGELTAGIAHEIQNPLNFVNNFSDVSTELIDEMKTELSNGEIAAANLIADDIKQNLQKINHHGKRADSIVKSMLQHSKASTGKKELTDMNKLADEYLRLAYHGLRAKDKSFNAECNTDFDERIAKIHVVPQDFGRVMLNLFNNAFHAVNEKRKSADGDYRPLVSVQTKKLQDKVEIRVIDNGNGIPNNIVDKIFQPFFTTKPTGEGTGLGLSLSYDIIKAHGGEIKVETQEGQGSEFVILFRQNGT